MAIRIPTYERHVQLDAGAQTIPRFSADTSLGKGIHETGDAIMKVAAHWQAKQDSFDKMQMGLRVTELNNLVQQIHNEEMLKFNPAVDTLGTLHDRIQARVSQATQQFMSQAPSGLTKEYKAHADQYYNISSQNAGHEENNLRNAFGNKQIDGAVATLKQQLLKNPDSGDQAIAQMRQTIKDLAPISGMTPAQIQIAEEAHLKTLFDATTQGYAAQGRKEDGQAWARKFAADRNAEEIQNIKRSVDPSKYETKLSPDDEKKFQDWKAKFAPNDSGRDYDLRGAFKAGVTPAGPEAGPNEGHFPDTFKKPNHPTFSDQSQYATDRPDLAGKWNGDTFVPPSPPPRGGTVSSAPPIGSGQLNQNRIAQIDANPIAKAAIERAAQATGLDPNMLKVFASIESGGDHKIDSPNGKYKGLFQLGDAEFGMHNGGNGDVHNADDNAMAAAKLLVQRRNDLQQSLGREPTPTELYAGHQQGLGGTISHLSNPDQPAWKSMLNTGEGRDRTAKDGLASATAWAKSAISGNVPKDVVDRLYGGDATRMSSRDFMAVQTARVQGGGIDQAIQNAQGQQQPAGPRTVVASADGTVLQTRPPAYIGGVNVGGQQTTGAPAGRQTAPNVTEATAGKIRSQPIQDDLRGALNYAAGRSGVRVEVTSGGQDPHGQEGVTRTGSHRHDDGGAADVVLYDTKDGHKLDFTNEADRLRMGAFITDAVRTGAVTGVGGATNYMGNNTLHLGGGNTATWGAKGEQAPTWIQQAHNDGLQTKMNPDAAATAKALPTSPVQVAQAGAGTPSVAVTGSRWDQLATSGINMLEGSEMKASAIAQSMKISLAGRVKADVDATKANGNGIQLPKELQDYYHTPTPNLSYDMIANKLGTGAAIKWQQDKDYAQKVYNGGAHMEDMPRQAILDRLQKLTPDSTSPYYDDQIKVYNEVLKKAQGIDRQRNADPAGFADQDPVVAAAKKAAQDDPQNQEKTQALVTARMNRQTQMGINPVLQTPITNEEAKQLGQPLLNRALANREQNAPLVAENIQKFVGKATAEGVPDLQQRALETVLKNRKITDQQAAATAEALTAAQHPPASPLLPGQKPEKLGVFDSAYMAKEGYYNIEGAPYLSPIPFYSRAGEEKQNNPDMTGTDTGAGDFVPGARYIPTAHIEMLKKDPSLADMFDNGGDGISGYGKGAAAHFLKGGVNTPSGNVLAAPPAAPPQDAITSSPITATVADPLNPQEEQTTTQPEDTSGDQ